ncbi:MAG: DUF5668 domain-containing protein [Bacteroidota bacterium]
MEANHYHCTKGSSKGKIIIIGLVLISAGALWLMKNMGMLSEEAIHIIFSWKMILITIGFISLFGHNGKVGGVIMMLIGGYFLTKSLPGVPQEFHQLFWPVVLIAAGIIVIIFLFFRARPSSISSGSVGVSDDYLEEMTVFGGIERTVYSKNFKGGKLSQVFGGSKLNLMNATLDPNNDNVIDLTCVFGGSTIIVPPDWHIKVKVNSIFGGFVDKRSQQSVDDSKSITIRGSIIFGGGEIKTY